MTHIEEDIISRRASITAVPGAALGSMALASSAVTLLSAGAAKAARSDGGTKRPPGGAFAWGPGPRSGLPWWSGGWSALAELEKLRYCPDNTDIIGPDYYDHFPASRTQAEWDRNVRATGVEGGPVGLQRWLEFCQKKGRPLGIGEWGIGAETAEEVEQPGGDNPVFIRNMIGFVSRNRNWMAYEAYFNSERHRLHGSGQPTSPAASAAYREAFAAIPEFIP